MDVKQLLVGYMNKILRDYNEIRGKPISSLSRAFWDVVVITTADKMQQEAYLLQIDEKKKRKELPDDLPIHIVSDPPGVRIGNGGSTLTALEYLEEVYGHDMFKKKVLMIHAGGWSQRMPSATILGKVFSLLPHGNSPYQMLDLKLALYWPFVDRLSAGVFVTCADDFVVYSLDEKHWRFPDKGFTALAHPSPMELGRTHGVFVLKDIGNIDKTSLVEVRRCLQILQKPNEERMLSHGAVLPGTSHEFGGCISIEGEAVYTDSSFYFATDVMETLLTFKKSVGNLGCEIDAYGDFLQAVGEHATNNYIHLTGNVSQLTDNLLATRQAVFDCLRNTDVHVLVMNASKFVHIGTTKELIHHLCQDNVFQQELILHKDVFNAWTNKQKETEDVHVGQVPVPRNTCIMHCCIDTASYISSDCVLDFCHFDIPVNIQSGCIISNAQLLEADAGNLISNLTIPENTFIHTVPMYAESTTRFVTVFFHISDNLKKSVSLKNLDSLQYLSSDIGSFLISQGLAQESILPHDCRLTEEVRSGSENTADGFEDRKISLWSLKLFPALDNMTLSFQDALAALSVQTPGKISKKECTLYSLQDLLRLKDVRSMLSFRSELYDNILKDISTKQKR